VRIWPFNRPAAGARAVEREAKPVLGPTKDQAWSVPYPIGVYSVARNRVTPQLMREIADRSDVVSSCIGYLVRSASVVPLYVAGPDAAKAEEMLKPWGGIGGEGNRRSNLEAMLLRDILTIGRCAVWVDTLGQRALPLDAATIHPRLVDNGALDPEKPYEQRVHGSVVTVFGPDEIVVDGLYPTTAGPYYLSPIEACLDAVEALIACDEYRRGYFKYGDAPTRLMEIPDTMSREMADAFLRDLHSRLSGSVERHRIIPVPQGCKLVNNSEPVLDWSDYERSLIHRICAVYGVSPAVIGYEGDIYKSSQETAVDSTVAWGLTPLLEIRASVYTRIFRSFGLDAEATNGEPDEIGDEVERSLRMWEKRCLSRIRRKRSPYCESPGGIPRETESLIQNRLKTAKTAHDVRMIFRDDN